MLFVETRIFSEDVRRLLTDDEYAGLQCHLAGNPRAGALLIGTGGLRKIRWMAGGKGKSGGVRVIYYYRLGARPDPDDPDLQERHERRFVAGRESSSA